MNKILVLIIVTILMISTFSCKKEEIDYAEVPLYTLTPCIAPRYFITDNEDYITLNFDLFTNPVTTFNNTIDRQIYLDYYIDVGYLAVKLTNDVSHTVINGSVQYNQYSDFDRRESCYLSENIDIQFKNYNEYIFDPDESINLAIAKMWCYIEIYYFNHNEEKVPMGIYEFSDEYNFYLREEPN